jgi:23S rRNA (guanosine2251-2'-O)-methyltransferase
MERLVEEDAEVVAGRRPVEEAFAAGRPARRLLVVPQRRAALEAIVLHATTLRIPVVEVEGGTLTAVAGFDGHQGVAVVVEQRRWASLDDVFARAMERGERPFVLVLDSLEDPQNIGTLLRSAEACGVHGILFPTRHAAPLTASAVKASAGAVEHLLLVPVSDLGGNLVDLRGRGLRVVGADSDAALSYRDADLRGPVALVVGSEGQGIAGHIRRRLDLAVRIPMKGRIASLNAAVAGSILLFEAAAQRGGMTAVPLAPASQPQAAPVRDAGGAEGAESVAATSDVAEDAVPEAAPADAPAAASPAAAAPVEDRPRPRIRRRIGSSDITPVPGTAESEPRAEPEPSPAPEPEPATPPEWVAAATDESAADRGDTSSGEPAADATTESLESPPGWVAAAVDGAPDPALSADVAPAERPLDDAEDDLLPGEPRPSRVDTAGEGS